MPSNWLPEVWPAVLLGAAYQDQGDGAGLVAPAVSAAPAIGLHEIEQQLAHGQRFSLERFRPGEPGG